MTAQSTIWLALEGELITAVENVAPNNATMHRFKWRSHDEQESAADIVAAAGATRLFQFDPPGPAIPDMGIGHTTRHKELTFALQIIYPGGPIWKTYAADDADNLAHTLRGTAFSYADYVNPTLEAGATIEPIVTEEGGSSGWVLSIPFHAPVQIS
jgi:hypothetical protein